MSRSNSNYSLSHTNTSSSLAASFVSSSMAHKNRDDLSINGLILSIKEWLAISNNEEYNKFCEMTMSLRAWSLFAFFILVIQLPFYYTAYLLDLTTSSELSVLGVAVVALIWIKVLVVIIVMNYLYFYNQKNNVDSRFNILVRPHVTTLRTMLALSLTSFYGFRLITRVLRGPCDPYHYRSSPYSWTCNPQHESKGLPPESIITIMIMQIVFSIVLRDVRMGVLLLCWALVIACIWVSVALGGASNYYYAICTYVIVSIFVLLETMRHHVTLYYATVELKEAVRENEAMQSKMHATEMRHMIANVAHDLKTPLTSFLSGIELISEVAMDVQRKIGENKVTLAYLQDNVLHILNCVHNIRNTNSFMLMTINRCIDYTKASKGLKLVPKFETIDLLDTLSLPLNCMKDIQSRVTIRQYPIPPEVCSHIITDKQWLQENVLCLLSNAIKYSSGGEVTLQLFLVPGSQRTSRTKAPKRLGSMSDSKRALALFSQASQQRVHPVSSSDAEDAAALEEGNILFNEAEEGDAEDDADAQELIWPQEGKECDRSEYLRIEVEDNGIGLSEDAMHALFNPFKQAQRLAGGTGLGLYSLARRVEALNGFYGVLPRRDSEQGSIFWFSLPYRPDKVSANSLRRSIFPRRNESLLASIQHLMGDSKRESAKSGGSKPVGPGPPEDEEESSKSSRSTQSAMLPPFHVIPSTSASFPSPDDASDAIDASQLVGMGEGEMCVGGVDHDSTRSAAAPKLQILVVDDSPAIVKMTSMMLRQLGHFIVIAENGDVALKKIWERLEQTKGVPFDVVLMDLQMPVMDGLEATRRLRSLETSSSLGEEIKLSPSGSPNFSRNTKRKHFNRPGLSSFSSDNGGEGGSPSSKAAAPIHQFVIGVSANSDHTTMQEALAAGVDAFMSKPFTIETFYDTYEKMKGSRLSFSPS